MDTHPQGSGPLSRPLVGLLPSAPHVQLGAQAGEPPTNAHRLTGLSGFVCCNHKGL